MKIYDCTTFYSEHMMMDVRFSILNKYVEKFVVTESLYSHSGRRKTLNFDINNYPKYKNKIIYLVIDKEPNDLIEIEQNNVHKRLNSIKRIELSYNYMNNAIKDVAEDDLIILSDNDEIPNLDSKRFKESNKNFIIFKQLLFYYKFNLFHELMPWFGSKACKKKCLKSFSDLRNLKNKKYPFWRLDSYFSNIKEISLEIIPDGGWHFTNIKTAEEIHHKMRNFLHHFEYERSGLDPKMIEKLIKNKKALYNYNADQRDSKWSNNTELEKINLKLLPDYINENLNKYRNWLS